MAIKKLIEVALPLEKINAECAREKSIRHGHPSTLHLWWARRPLAAARAVIWASLVDDPSSHPEEFPTEEDQSLERQRLFGILEKLVVWENSNNAEVISASKNEILKYTGGNPPDFLDPFAGGGAIPLEAKRLGLKSYAHDLNPIPVTINKAMLEIPSSFAGLAPVHPYGEQKFEITYAWRGMEGVAKDIGYYGQIVKNKLYEKIGKNYPDLQIQRNNHKEIYPVIAWLWARTVKCPNPACGCQMPLMKSNVIAKGIAYVDVTCNQQHRPVFSVKNGIPLREFGTVNRKGAVCAFCGTAVSFSYIRDEGKASRIGTELMAVVGKGPNGRVYVSPTNEHILAAIVPDRPELNLGTLATYPGYLNPPPYGFDTFQSLFTPRQLQFLVTCGDTLTEVTKEIENDAIKKGFANDHVPLVKGGSGAFAYSQAIKVYLSFVIDKIADYNSSICSWNAVGQKMRNTFGLTGMSMSWDFAEANPFSGASGSFDNMLDWVVKSVENLPVDGCGTAYQMDAQSDSGLRQVMISTDPPYYSNVPYADFADFFYVWLRRNIGDVYPELYSTMLTPKTEELVADPYRQGGKDMAATHFENGMCLACSQMYKASRDDIPVTIYYAFKQSDTEKVDEMTKVASTGWETMLTAIISAGFSITGTWPIRTEMSSRTRGMNSNALASSIVLACRKRTIDAPQTTRRNLVIALRRELRPALKKLQDSNIAPVDLAQSAIGPGMGVFSQYRRVLEADGSCMSVRSALQIINEEIDLYFNEQVGDLDKSSRFCVDFYTQNAYNDMKYGEAEILANAKGASISLMVGHGILYAKAGLVHLIERDRLPKNVDKDEENIWLITQQLTYAMTTGGIESCAKILAPMYGSNAERAKDLAYRLYTIAEKKNWTTEAYVYNALVVAWPDIQSRAAALKLETPEQINLFDL